MMLSLIERDRVAVIEWVLWLTVVVVDRVYETWAAAVITLGLPVAIVVAIYLVTMALFVAWILWCVLLDAWDMARGTVRRWCVPRELRVMAAERERERIVRSTALTGSTGVPRSVYEGDHPPAGGPTRAA